MVFLVIIPGIPAALGNIILPIQLGAQDVAFPRLNLVVVLPVGRRRAAARPRRSRSAALDTGWTFYTPYIARRPKTAVLIAVLGVFLLGFSSIFTGLNFLVTIHKFRPQGMGWFRLPLNMLGDLRDRDHPGPRDAGARHHGAAARRSSASRTSASSIRRSAATRCCSSTSSGSTRTRPSTS